MSRTTSHYRISYRSRKLTGEGFTRRIFWIAVFESAVSWSGAARKQDAQRFTEVEARMIVAALVRPDIADVTVTPPLPTIV